jgi:hypothetical protein
VDRFFSLDGLLNKADGLIGLKIKPGATLSHSMQTGLLVFTPEEVSITQPIFDDHPYSNLIFLSNSRQWRSVKETSVVRSSLMIGLLGTNTARNLQQGLHKLISVEEANGWHNQISDGGEPTFRYTLSRSSILTSGYNDGYSSFDIATSMEGNVGYMTDVNAGISMRFGKINPLGLHSLPESSDHFTTSYASVRVPGSAPEFFAIAGVNARIRAYNVLLQGQFRHSEVTFSHSQMNPLIGEVWLGAGAAFSNGWQASFAIRARTKEFDAQRGRHVWGGLTLSKESF